MKKKNYQKVHHFVKKKPIKTIFQYFMFFISKNIYLHFQRNFTIKWFALFQTPIALICLKCGKGPCIQIDWNVARMAPRGRHSLYGPQQNIHINGVVLFLSNKRSWQGEQF